MTTPPGPPFDPRQGPPPVPQPGGFSGQPPFPPQQGPQGPGPQAPPFGQASGFPPGHAGPGGPGPAGPVGPPPPGWSGPGWAPGQQGPQQGPSAPPSPDAVRRIAQILCPILVLAGLSIPQGGSVGWADYTLWALFAAAMSLAQLVTLSTTRNPGQSAVVALIATGALVAYWVVIVLPGISSNGGFLQTLGVGCAAVGAWLGGGRR
jgi:hypothetical protein